MICEKNELDNAEMAAIQRQLGQKEQELLVLQQAKSDLRAELESHREAAALHEARTAELTTELASSSKKLLAAEATVHESARELQEHVDQLQMMRRKEAQLSREVSKSEAQVHAMYCLNTLMTHPNALEIFCRLDTSGDGRLDASELHIGLREMGEVLTEVEMEELMSFVDEDGDGTIVYEELAKVGRIASELQKKGDEVAVELKRQQHEHSAALTALRQEQQEQQALAGTAQSAAMEQEMERLREELALAKQQVAKAQAQVVEAVASEREAATKLAESLESQESTEELLEVAEEETEVATARLEDTIRQFQCKEEEVARLLKAHSDVQAVAAAQAGELQKLRSEVFNGLEHNDQNQMSSSDDLLDQAWLDELEKSRLEQSAAAVEVTTPAGAAAPADEATSDTCDSDARTWAAEWLEDWISEAVGVRQ